jgi:hypothetical protein
MLSTSVKVIGSKSIAFKQGASDIVIIAVSENTIYKFKDNASKLPSGCHRAACPTALGR